MTIALLMQVFALVFLVLAACGIQAPRVHLGWMGLALWLASTLLRL
jgi:hypothetical protein